MKNDNKGAKGIKGYIIPIAVAGCLIIAIILIFGTLRLGRIAGRDTKEAVRNVSLLYLSELAGRREQVVSSTLDGYVNNLDIAIGLLTDEDLQSIENLQAYQTRIKQLYRLDRFAFVDTDGLIYTSRGTRNDIDQYGKDLVNLNEPEILIKNLNTRNKKIVVAVPLDNLKVQNITLTTCFMEIDMEEMLNNVSLQSNNSTTFCNIYSRNGVSMTEMVLGGLAVEDNLLDAMKNAVFEPGSSREQMEKDFLNGVSGVVSFTYNGISETLYYVPVRGTDWMLTYLIRESVIGEQIDSISDAIILRSLLQSGLTSIVLLTMFILIFIQQRRVASAAIDREVSETENRIRQQELEEQLAMQEELLEQEKKRAEQDKMITALSSDYRCVYYVDLDTDDAICYRREADTVLPYEIGDHFHFFSTLSEYADKYVSPEFRDGFMNFINPVEVRKALANEAIIAFRYLTVIDGKESYEMLRMAGVRHPEDREDNKVHAIGLGFADIDAEMRESMARSKALSDALKSAEDASRAKSGFVSNMSHEIRTPITAILGMNEMIRRESSDNNILSYAENINNAGTSLLGIISDILDFSKIEAGRMVLTSENYSLRSLLNDLYNLIRFRAEAKGLEFEITADKTLPVGLTGDELRVKQIILNLLTNAVKYTERGSVRLELKRLERDTENSRIKFSVSVFDTGIGIKEEEIEKLFVPFERLDLARNRSVEGTGLGLSISRQLLNMMDSELRVESVYNSGSRFWFELWQDISDPDEIGDYDPEDQILNTGTDDTAESIFTAPGKRILIVDDMPMNLQVVSGLLKRTGMEIDTASSGEECIKKFGSEAYDMVFMDYRMPGLDGIETLKKLMELYPEKTERTPILALTASATMGDRDRLLATGFNDYLSKPVNISEMESKLKMYLGEGTTESPEAPAPDAGIAGIPEEIAALRELDCKTGIEYCGDAEDYIFALRTYADSTEEKARQLEECLNEERIDDYSLIAHSLKSMSRSIGANRLHDMAKALEKAGNEGSFSILRRDTPAFLEEYRKLGSTLREILPGEE